MSEHATRSWQRLGEIFDMSVVTVPDQTPLSRGRQRIEEKREVLNRTIDVANEAEEPVSGLIRIGHHPADAITNTLIQHECDAVMMDWRGKRASTGRDVVLGPTLEWVGSKAECHLYVEKTVMKTDVELDSIILSNSGGPHVDFTRETSRTAARTTGASVHLVAVVSRTRTPDQQFRTSQIW